MKDYEPPVFRKHGDLRQITFSPTQDNNLDINTARWRYEPPEEIKLGDQTIHVQPRYTRKAGDAEQSVRENLTTWSNTDEPPAEVQALLRNLLGRRN